MAKRVVVFCAAVALAFASMGVGLASDASGSVHAATAPVTTWQAPVLADPSAGSLVSVSCGAVTLCVGGDAAGAVVSYNGSALSKAQIGSTGDYIGPVSCASSSFCVAIDQDPLTGSTIADVLAGGAWTAGPSLPQADTVSCTSSTFCVAMSSAGSFYRFDGTTWSAAASADPQSGGGEDVSCVGSTFCLAVDDSGNALTYNGTAWSSPTVIGGGLPAIDVTCVSATYCLAVDGAGTITKFTGTQWTPVAAPAAGSPSALTCTTATFCLAAVGGAVTVFNGTSWSPATTLFATESIRGLACVGASYCVAVDADQGARYRDKKWSAPVLVDHATGSPQSLSCIGNDVCRAVDINGNVLTYRPSNGWTTPKTIDPGHNLASIACPSAGTCNAIDFQGNWLKYANGTWTKPALIDSGPAGAGLESLSCPTITFCMAIDNSGSYLTYNGSSWTSPLQASVGGLNRADCVSAQFCLAGAGAGLAVYDGTSWSAATAPPFFLTGFTCVSSIYCVGTGLDFTSFPATSVVATFSGTSWSNAIAAPSGTSLSTISCATTTRCLIGANATSVIQFDGTSLSTPVPILPGTSNVAALDCTGPTFCAAVGTDGYAATTTT